jgi:hypothetical protein
MSIWRKNDVSRCHGPGTIEIRTGTRAMNAASLPIMIELKT